MAQTEAAHRSLIQDFIFRLYGVQVQQGHYYLGFTDQAGNRRWIDPNLSMKEAFMYARECLNERVFMSGWAFGLNFAQSQI